MTSAVQKDTWAPPRKGSRVKGLPAIAYLLFAISVLPPIFMLLPKSYDAEPLQERRPLAPAVTRWEGRFYNIDGNFRLFQRWFDDHLGLRNFMVRAKNEIDYRVFGTSTRVYYGKHGQIFGRSIADREIPFSEQLLGEPGKIEAIHEGIWKFTERLQAEGITPIYVFPYSKQYFLQRDMPLIAPKLKFPTHFQEMNQVLLADPRLHVIDTYTPMIPAKAGYQTYLLEDFHWTDASAFTIAKQIVGEISKMEGRPHNVWTNPLVITKEMRQGSEARFAARLFKSPINDASIEVTHKKRPEIKMDPKTTGFEYQTDMVEDPALLPPTCLYGNSFSDGMTYAGLPVYFQQFIHLDRDGLVTNAPERIKGRCKYLIVQILDLQAGLLNSFTQQ